MRIEELTGIGQQLRCLELLSGLHSFSEEDPTPEPISPRPGDIVTVVNIYHEPGKGAPSESDAVAQVEWHKGSTRRFTIRVRHLGKLEPVAAAVQQASESPLS